MDYSAALSQLHSLETFGIMPGLTRIRELARRLGDPQQAIPLFIHTAGTNGKGSVCAMTESILRAAGKKTGLFTSPHLHTHRERYQINSIPISEDDFAHLFTKVLHHIDRMKAEGLASPTEFEAVTALALLYFAEYGVDVAIMEAGMGGRDDSTNIINAQIAVLTDIDLDHMAYLGNTIQEIAANKADIIQPGATAITIAAEPALSVISATATQRDAQLLAFGRDMICEPLSITAQGSYFSLTLPDQHFTELFLPLLGEHQLKNAAAAVQAAILAGADETAIRQGLTRVKWPGRLEMISKEPPILLDCAHNYAGMCSLIAALERFWPEKKKRCLLAMLGDKERKKCLELLLPQLSGLVVTRSPYLSRSEDWSMPVTAAQNGGVPTVAEEDPEQALQIALKQLAADEMLLVCGSIYMVAGIRDILMSEDK